MKLYIKVLLSIFVLITIYSCNGTQTNEKQSTLNTTDTELKEGGLYISREENGNYSISKILVLDGDIVHIRAYGNSFSVKPTAISSDTLKMLIGHVPMAKEGFLIEKPELLKVEPVKESELEGYKIYMEEMSKQ
ncbi:MAG: hypothetical protein QM731_01875 [Chitinophagaceae bacterium]